MGKIAPTKDRIRALNDMLRQTGIGGQVMISNGIASLDESDRTAIIAAVQQFDDFTEDNDPYLEHDCGIVSWNRYRVMFKIDYFDLTLKYHSNDPADPGQTKRVMTIMFPEER